VLSICQLLAQLNVFVGESDKRHATLVIGQPNAPPTSLSVTKLSEDMMNIGFTPHNSNHSHLVYIDDELIRRLGPSIFQVSATNLRHVAGEATRSYVTG